MDPASQVRRMPTLILVLLLSATLSPALASVNPTLLLSLVLILTLTTTQT